MEASDFGVAFKEEPVKEDGEYAAASQAKKATAKENFMISISY
jgi:hypothetical protein